MNEACKKQVESPQLEESTTVLDSFPCRLRGSLPVLTATGGTCVVVYLQPTLEGREH